MQTTPVLCALSVYSGMKTSQNLTAQEFSPRRPKQEPKSDSDLPTLIIVTSKRGTGQSKPTHSKNAAAPGFPLVGGVGCGDVRDSQEGVKAAMGQHPGVLGPCLLPTDQKVIQHLDGGWN